MALTATFPPEIKPIRKGVYHTWMHGIHHYCKWNGKLWLIGHDNLEDAKGEIYSSGYQKRSWMGFTTESTK